MRGPEHLTPWKAGRQPRDRSTLPEALQDDMRCWMQMSAPMPDSVKIRMCGCREEPWDRIVLCDRHEGFLAALDIGYHDGYMEALGAVDRMDRRTIEEQAPIAREDLAASIKVPLWAALFAVRYGMARHTYACADAGRLAYNLWDSFPIHAQEQIRRDVVNIDPAHAGAWEWLQNK